jgi:serine/tyrosine/threonine adenylyltransferase
LVSELLTILQLAETDMTIFYRRLAELDATQDPAAWTGDACFDFFKEAYYVAQQCTPEVREQTLDWVRIYLSRISRDGLSNETRKMAMNSVNPKYVLRNYLAQLAIDQSTQGDHSLVNELLEVLRNPYAEQPEKEAYAQKRPEWARQRPGCSMLSCSS